MICCVNEPYAENKTRITLGYYELRSSLHTSRLWNLILTSYFVIYYLCKYETSFLSAKVVHQLQLRGGSPQTSGTSQGLAAGPNSLIRLTIPTRPRSPATNSANKYWIYRLNLTDTATGNCSSSSSRIRLRCTHQSFALFSFSIGYTRRYRRTLLGVRLPTDASCLAHRNPCLSNK